MGNSISKEQQEEINNKIEEIKEEIEKEKEYYNKNKTNNEYKLNIKYENYEEEIIEGESILDCELEDIERQLGILSLYYEIIQKCEKIKNKINDLNEINIKIKEEIEEEENNFKKINETINNLIEISEIELEKEKKNENKQIEIIENKNEKFENELLQFEIKTLRRKCKLKKEEKDKIEKWCKLKMDSIIFDSNIHNWKKMNLNLVI